MVAVSLENIFADAPPCVDRAAIRDSLTRLHSHFKVDHWILPLPPWALRPYTESGPEAWKMLQHDLAHAPRRERPMCIYFHIPFCDAKCGFCDSYSFKLGGRRADHVEAYIEMLCGEMALWCRQGDLGTRPVSTVHFGGGTPTFLDSAELARIVDTCAKTFAVTDTTEWALESTAAGLTPSMLACLHARGFRRLHIGVQSMEDAVRTAIGRRSAATHVSHTIEAALALGWIVSVDLICGLPGQTFAGFLAGISTLAELGVEGVSLYELLIYPQNRHWADRHLLTFAQPPAQLRVLSCRRPTARTAWLSQEFIQPLGQRSRRQSLLYLPFPR